MNEIIKTRTDLVHVDHICIWSPARFLNGSVYIAGHAYKDGQTSYTIGMIQDNFTPGETPLLPDFSLSGEQLDKLITKLQDIRESIQNADAA